MESDTCIQEVTCGSIMCMHNIMIIENELFGSKE